MRATHEHVEAFRTRPLDGRYPYVFLDAKVEKVRDGGRVVNKARVIAHGVHESGRREILGIDVGEAATEAFWTDSCAASSRLPAPRASSSSPPRRAGRVSKLGVAVTVITASGRAAWTTPGPPWAWRPSGAILLTGSPIPATLRKGKGTS